MRRGSARARVVALPRRSVGGGPVALCTPCLPFRRLPPDRRLGRPGPRASSPQGEGAHARSERAAARSLELGRRVPGPAPEPSGWARSALLPLGKNWAFRQVQHAWFIYCNACAPRAARTSPPPLATCATRPSTVPISFALRAHPPSLFPSRYAPTHPPPSMLAARLCAGSAQTCTWFGYNRRGHEWLLVERGRRCVCLTGHKTVSHWLRGSVSKRVSPRLMRSALAACGRAPAFSGGQSRLSPCYPHDTCDSVETAHPMHRLSTQTKDHIWSKNKG
eukprot:5008943-Prymnesium_polylepis.2